MINRFNRHMILFTTILLFAAFGYASNPREELVKNASEQLNYLDVYNRHQLENGTPKKQWFIYFLGSTVEDLKNIINETEDVGDDYLMGLNDRLELINRSDKTVVYVAFTKYKSTLTTPLFPKEFNTLTLQENYIQDFFKGWNEFNVESFSIFTSEYKKVIKDIYERTWLSNLNKDNVLLPFSMYSTRILVSKTPNIEPEIKELHSYHLYAPNLEMEFDKGAFNELYKSAISYLGVSPIEKKMEKAVSAIEDYFIDGSRPNYNKCAEVLNSETYKDLAKNLPANDIWMQLIDDDPCLLNTMYPLDREYVDSSQFERELMIFVCTPLALAFAIPVGTLAGNAAFIALVKQYGKQRVKEASLAMLYEGIIQTVTNYYFDEKIASSDQWKARFNLSVSNINEKDIVIEGLKELIAGDLKSKAAIACILQGIKYEDDKWYGINKIEGFDFSRCSEEILKEYTFFIGLKAASPLFNKLKLLITRNPNQFIKGVREIILDSNLGPEIRDEFLNSLKVILEDLKTTDLLKIQLDVEGALTEACKEYAEEVATSAIKNLSLPTAKINYSFENTIKNAAVDIEKSIRSGISDMKVVNANITISLNGTTTRVPLLTKFNDGSYKITFVIDNTLLVNTLEELMPTLTDNQRIILRSLNQSNAPPLILKGQKAKVSYGEQDVPIDIREIEVYTIEQNGNVKRKKISGYNGVKKANKFTVKQIDDYVEFATKNKSSIKVMLGKYGDGGPGSYIKRAGDDYTYFDLGTVKWREAENLVSNDPNEMWKINKKFIDRQLELGKDFYFSHEPWIAKLNEYLSKEAEYLIDLGAKDFKQINDNTWKVIW